MSNVFCASPHYACEGSYKVRKEICTENDLSDQSTGDARHGGRRVASATEGIKIVRDVSEPMSACDKGGSSITLCGTASRANSQTEHESS